MKRKIILSIVLAICFVTCAAMLCISAADSKAQTSKNGLYRYTVDEKTGRQSSRTPARRKRYSQSAVSTENIPSRR